MAYKDPEQRRAYQKEYRRKNHEALKAKHRDRYAKNRESMRTKARIRNANLDPVTKGRRNRVKWLRMAHGMRPEDWAHLWATQGGCCYLCGDFLEDGWRTHIDHDHLHCPPGQTCQICRRGIACFDCNLVLGHTRDDPARLRRMADALEAAQAAAEDRKMQAGAQLTLNIG